MQPAALRPESKHLPVLPAPRIKRSRAGLWRAAVLILVHVLIAIHVVHWQQTGRTVSPLEPSEGMEFAKRGVINAGFVFFALAILSTLIFGRWFCGWCCHLVALQDLARWLLAKIGIRPKPIRSSVIAIVPMIAFIYMFISPALQSPAARTVLALQKNVQLEGTRGPDRHLELVANTRWRLADQAEMTTREFWKTFPAWPMAIVTLVAAGFLIVYVLGAKGFCFSGCPYGAIFGVADRFAPLRIRVTDDCTGSGHCTGVCTSNVRVHEEVRDFGMVVDPGCMKCLDCVEVCPNEALYPGWGTPERFAKRTTRAVAPPKPAGAADRSLHFAVLLLFAFAFSAMAHGFDVPQRFQLSVHQWLQSGVVALCAVLVTVLLRNPRHAPRGCSLAEEIALALFFLFSLFAFRGYAGISFLLALGIAAMMAWAGNQTWQLFLKPQLAVHGFRLKQQGRFLPATWGFLAVMAALLATATHAVTRQFHALGTIELREQLNRAGRELAASGAPESLARSIDLQRAILEREPGSLGDILSLGYLLTRAERFDEAQTLYDDVIGHPQHAKDGRLHFQYGMLDTLRQRPTDAMRRFEQAVELAPDWPEARITLARALMLEGRAADSMRQFDECAKRFPSDPDVLATVGMAYLQIGEADRGREFVRSAAKIAPTREDIRQLLEQVERRD